MKYTMDAQVRYLLSSCQSAVCHRTFYVTELFISHLFNLFPQYDSHNFCPPLLPGTFLVPAKRRVLMPRICAISILINLSGCASTFFHRVRWEMHFTGVLISGAVLGIAVDEQLSVQSWRRSLALSPLDRRRSN